MFTIIVSTIGPPYIKEMLLRFESFPPPEILVVVDMLGRETTNLNTAYPIKQLEAELAVLACKPRLVLYKPIPEKWAVMNGCYNVGMGMAKYDYCWFTHDDMLVDPQFNYPKHINKVLKNIDKDGRIIMGKKVQGLMLPGYEVRSNTYSPPWPDKSQLAISCLTNGFSPVGSIIHKEAVREIGGFDEEYGIWYDGQYSTESVLRDWWYVFLPTAFYSHVVSKTFVFNNWANGWKANPKWGHYPDNYLKKFGNQLYMIDGSRSDYQPPPARNFGIIPEGFPRLTDKRFGPEEEN